jgi:hypothetical protein
MLRRLLDRFIRLARYLFAVPFLARQVWLSK